MDINKAEKMFKNFGCSHFYMHHDGKESEVKEYFDSGFEKFEDKWICEEIERLIFELENRKTKISEFWISHGKLIRLMARAKNEIHKYIKDVLSLTKKFAEKIPPKDRILISENILGRNNLKQEGMIEISDRFNFVNERDSFISLCDYFLSQAVTSKYTDDARINDAKKKLNLFRKKYKI